MIQSVIPNQVAPIGMRAPHAAVQTQGPDFGTFLVQSPGSSEPAGPPMAIPVAAPSAAPDGAELPLTPAMGGSILPPIEPAPAFADQAGSAEADLCPIPTLQNSAVQPRPTNKAAKLFARQAKAEAKLSVAIGHQKLSPLENRPAESGLAETGPALVVLPAISGVQFQPNSSGTPPPSQHSARSEFNPSEPAFCLPTPKDLTNAKPNPEPAAQALAHAAPQAAFLREVMASVADSQPAASAAAPGVEQTPARAPAAIRLEVALPVTASKLSEKTPVSTRRLLSAGVGLIAPSLIAPASGPFQFADVALSPQVQNPRPQDFAAQVDRLVAAREAAQPQGGLLIVAHAEFGKVELRFRRDERGLAVSLASPDPDFAQAAAAAAPATLPFNTAHFEHAEGRQAGTRGGGGPATDGSATNQSRGQQSEHRGETSGERNQHLRGMSHRSAARRSGIFA